MKTFPYICLVFSLAVSGLPACPTSPQETNDPTPEASDLETQSSGEQPPSEVSDRKTQTEGEPPAREINADSQVTDEEAADAVRITCERIRARASSFVAEPEMVSIEELTSEGGFVDVFHLDDEVARVHGEMLTGSSRLRFDYILRDGELLCAKETISNVHVSMEEEVEKWENYWHHQHLVFSEGELVSVAKYYTADAENRGRETDRVLEFFDSVLSIASSPSQ